MARWIEGFFWALLRFAFRRRYRVSITGLERLARLRGPTLVLPNHPAYVDPAILLSHLRSGPTLRPLVFSGMYRRRFLYPLMRLVHAFEVPDLREHSRDSQKRTLELIEHVAARLSAGDSFLIYPSGRLQRGDREIVGGARMAVELVERCPQVEVVLVRTRGLWGSRFSCARTGDLPPLGRECLIAAGWALLGLLFFLPRRSVTIVVEPIAREALPPRTRAEFNAFLESWYNVDGAQSPTFVRYHHLLGPRQGTYAGNPLIADIDLEQIKPAVRDTVWEILEDHLKRPLEAHEKTKETLLDGLGLDSLERMDIALQIEHQFGFRSDEVATTVGGLMALAAGQSGQTKPAKREVPALWESPVPREPANQVLAETLAEAFVRRALTHPNDAAVADPMTGVLSYRRLLVAATLMARRIARFEGDAVGILMPASAATDIAFLAVQMAGKLPVMLNWTTGPAGLEYAVKKLDIRHLITSHRFLDRLGIEIPAVRLEFLEDLRKSITKLEALRVLIRTYIVPHSFLHRLPPADPEQPAVVLFTSGSESAPKAVPLTHRNLIANVRAGTTAMEFSRDDRLLGFLPPFHSFGLSATTLMPLLTGTRVVHYPNPTDARGLVHMIATYRPTLLFTTPTFLSYMLSVADAQDLASVRNILTGAEKCPEELRQTCATMIPHAHVLEGYGITECSPVVSVNRPGRVKSGSIGQPLEGVLVLVVDPETHQPVSSGATGLLLVRGPTIFNGYLQYDGADPFVTVDGHRWYNTGDLVALDADGFIHFQGRLKRFLKAAGEMISLPALEEPFQRRFPADEQGPQVAVEGTETPDGRHIVLFSRPELSLREANAILLEAGLRGVMRVDEVRHVEQIPVLGTGKTDYKKLRQQILVESAPSANG